MTSLSLIMAAAGAAASVTTSPGIANFTTSGGQILSPTGQVFIAQGFDVLDIVLPHMVTNSACQPLLTVAPYTNCVCIAYTGPDFNTPAYANYASPSTWLATYGQYISWLTGLGIVVVITDYTNTWNAATSAGTHLAAEQAWFAALATNYISNAYVWFITGPNEGGDASVSAEHFAVYSSIRATGNANLVGFCCYDGLTWTGVPVGASLNATTGQYSTMHNVFWSFHPYGGQMAAWGLTETNAANCDTFLLDLITQANAFIDSASGVIPCLAGEFGNAQGGNGNTPIDGATLFQEVITYGTTITSGWMAWSWYWPGSGQTVQDQVVYDSTTTLTPGYGTVLIADMVASRAAVSSITSSGVPMKNHSLYYLTNVNPASVTPVANDFDVVVVDPTSDGGTGNTFWTSAQVAGMRKNPGGVVVAYFDMGGAENYRFYYAAAKAAGILSSTVNSWGENSVQYWSAEWLSIASSWAQKAVNSGFDGIYLDVSDCYTDPYCIANAPAAGGYAKGTMSAAGYLEIQFMANLKAYCQTLKKGFQLWENAGEGLSDTTLYGSNPRFVDVIDGALREQVIYLYPGNGNTPASGTVPIVTDTTADYDNLIRIINAGKPVTLTEYVGAGGNAIGGGTVTDPVLGKVTVAAGSTNAIHWVRQVCNAWNCGYYISVADYNVANGPTLSVVDTDGITIP